MNLLFDDLVSFCFLFLEGANIFPNNFFICGDNHQPTLKSGAVNVKDHTKRNNIMVRKKEKEKREKRRREERIEKRKQKREREGEKDEGKLNQDKKREKEKREKRRKENEDSTIDNHQH